MVPVETLFYNSDIIKGDAPITLSKKEIKQNGDKKSLKTPEVSVKRGDHKSKDILNIA